MAVHFGVTRVTRATVEHYSKLRSHLLKLMTEFVGSCKKHLYEQLGASRSVGLLGNVPAGPFTWCGRRGRCCREFLLFPWFDHFQM